MGSNISFDKALTKDVTVNENLSQDLIVTTSDKVKILLTEHHQIINKKMDWSMPLSVFITILLTLLTAKFETTFLGMTANVWLAVFDIACFVSGGFSVYYIFFAIYLYNAGSSDEFISKLKNVKYESAQANIFITLWEKIFRNPLNIKKAIYYYGNNYADVTLRVKELAKAKEPQFLITNELLGAEPQYGQRKTLDIDYVLDNKENTLRFYEKEIIDFSKF